MKTIREESRIVGRSPGRLELPVTELRRIIMEQVWTGRSEIQFWTCWHITHPRGGAEWAAECTRFREEAQDVG